MSYAKRKGSAAETGVVSYLAQWTPDAVETGEGLLFERSPSKGSNDEGDILGPFTCIEVKNYANPPLGALLTNAEWKATNARRPYWFLVYKAAGKGHQSMGGWHVVMTVQELIYGFGATPHFSDVFTSAMPPFTLDDLESWVPAACRDWDVLDGEFVKPAPKRSFPTYAYKPRFIFADMMSSIPARRQELWSEHVSLLNERDRTIPFIIHPRRGDEGMLPVGRWFAYTKLLGAARLLETLGVLPQDEAEYLKDLTSA